MDLLSLNCGSPRIPLRAGEGFDRGCATRECGPAFVVDNESRQPLVTFPVKSVIEA